MGLIQECKLDVPDRCKIFGSLGKGISWHTMAVHGIGSLKVPFELVRCCAKVRSHPELMAEASCSWLTGE